MFNFAMGIIFGISLLIVGGYAATKLVLKAMGPTVDRLIMEAIKGELDKFISFSSSEECKECHGCCCDNPEKDNDPDGFNNLF